MAGKPIGTIFVELDLDTTKYTKSQQAILASAKTTSLDVEKNWKIIGEKSDVMYDAMRQSVINAYSMIVNKAGTSAAEIVRAEEAKNTKLTALNEQQFGAQTSLLDTLKKNWVAVSAAAIAAYLLIQKAYSFGKDIALAANDIQRMSNTIGISTTEWQKFSYAAKMSDVSNESLMRGMKGLSTSMEEFNKKSGEGYLILTALGLSTVDVTGKQKPLTQMFKEVATELSKYEGGARMVDYANKLMGKSGMDLIPMFEGGGKKIDEYGDKLVKTGSVIGEVAIKAGSAAEDQFKNLDTRMNSMKINLAPLVLLFAKGAENLANMVNWITKPIEIPWWLGGGTFSFFTGLQSAQKEIEDFELAVSHGSGYASTYGNKLPLPPLLDPEVIRKANIEFHKLLSEAEKLSIEGKMPSWLDPLEELPKGYMMLNNIVMKTEDYIVRLNAEKKALEEINKLHQYEVPTEEQTLKMEARTLERLDRELLAKSEFEKQSALLGTEGYKREVIEAEQTYREKKRILEKEFNEGKINAETLATFIKAAELEKNNAITKSDEGLAKKRLEIDRKMAEDIGKFTHNEYQLKKDILDEQYRDYSKFVKDKNILDRWYDIRLIQLEEERALRSNNFFAGMKVAMNQNSRDQITWGQVGANVFKKFTDDAQKQLSDNLFNVLTGKFDELGVSWNSLWEGMLRTLTDKLAQMAVEAATAEIWKLLSPVVGEGLDWLSSIFAAKGIWDVKGAKEGIPVIAHPGEMIIPADLADLIREAGGGDSFATLQSMMETREGGKIPGLESFMTGMAKEQGKLATIGAIMAVTGKINPEQYMMGLFSPQAFAFSAVKGGIPAAFSSIFGLDVVGESKLKSSWGYTTAMTIATLLGAPLGIGALAGIIGQFFTPMIAKELYKAGIIPYDWLYYAPYEVGPYSPVAPGRESYWSGFGVPGEAGGGAEGGAAEGGAAEGGAGVGGYGGGEGYRWGGISRGPESGYWARLHGTEQIIPLKSGGARGQGTGITINFNVGGNLVANQQAFDDFIEKIDYALDKRARRVYS